MRDSKAFWIQFIGLCCIVSGASSILKYLFSDSWFILRYFDFTSYFDWLFLSIFLFSILMIGISIYGGVRLFEFRESGRKIIVGLILVGLVLFTIFNTITIYNSYFVHHAPFKGPVAYRRDYNSDIYYFREIIVLTLIYSLYLFFQKHNYSIKKIFLNSLALGLIIFLMDYAGKQMHDYFFQLPFHPTNGTSYEVIVLSSRIHQYVSIVEVCIILYFLTRPGVKKYFQSSSQDSPREVLNLQETGNPAPLV